MPLTSLPTSLLARSFTIAIAALALAPPAFAFPDKPLTLIVPYPPGGATDVVGRILAKALGAKLGQTVIVDNKAGAGTAIGAAALAQAAPDGHTLFKVIAVIAGKRVPLLPNAPTMVEAGYPSVVVEPWGALVAPGGLKPEVKKQLAKALADVWPMRISRIRSRKPASASRTNRPRLTTQGWRRNCRPCARWCTRRVSRLNNSLPHPTEDLPP